MKHTETIMDKREKEALQQIEALFSTQNIAVLATQKDGYPYASLMAFVVTADLKHLLFLTPTDTKKYEYLTASPNVALLIHNSQNFSSHGIDDIAVTAMGTATTVSGRNKDDLMPTFLTRHPSLKLFSAEPTTALVSVAITKYVVVSQFQNKIQIYMANG